MDLSSHLSVGAASSHLEHLCKAFIGHAQVKVTKTRDACGRGTSYMGPESGLCTSALWHYSALVKVLSTDQLEQPSEVSPLVWATQLLW